MSPLSVDAGRSDVRVRTVAKGLLSPLAHDLELRADGATGEGDGKRGKVSFAADKLHVVGVVKKDRVDTGVLSDSDRREIERKIRDEILAGPVTIDGELDGERVALTVATRKGSMTVRTAVTVATLDGGATEVRGACTVSLEKLGLGTIKGPMGVFKIADDVSVVFRVVFAAASA